MTITANTIINLLLKRHADDIAVPECKNGPTWSAIGAVRKFDLWVLRRSYSKPMTWIYEVKVSRQDFLRDDKWQQYLLYCTDFYFVAPAGIISPDEVPEQAGLLLTSKNGTRLYCKKKAPHRDIEIPLSVYIYILMSRTKIVNGYDRESKIDKATYWRLWLAEKKEKQELGYNVSKRIRQLYDENVTLAKARQARLDLKIEKLEKTKQILKEIGFDEKDLSWKIETRLKKRIAEINVGFPEGDVIKHLESAVLNIQNTIRVIQNIKDK